jgi:protein gp37
MNKQTKGAGIEWTHVPGYVGATANPVRGCKHGCEWRMPDGQIARCYAEVMAERLQKASDKPGRPYEHGFKVLTYHPEELATIEATTKPHAIFIDSMSDLFGQDSEDWWIESVHACAVSSPQHIFQALTKNPTRLPKFNSYPKNWWQGISAPPTRMFGKDLTLEQQRKWFKVAMDRLSETDATVRWASLEPLSFDLTDILARHEIRLDWAVVGAASNGAAKFQPDWEVFRQTVKVLRDRQTKVFFKGNICPRMAAECAGGWLAEFPEVAK